MNFLDYVIIFLLIKLLDREVITRRRFWLRFNHEWPSLKADEPYCGYVEVLIYTSYEELQPDWTNYHQVKRLFSFYYLQWIVNKMIEKNQNNKP